jgi:hypothetical protein
VGVIIVMSQMNNEMKQVISQYAERLKYPVNSFDELASGLGKDQVSVGGVSMGGADLKRLIPPYFFPMINKANFIEKANFLRVAEIRRHTLVFKAK